MFDRLKSLLADPGASIEKPDETLSAALLLTELARADLEFAEVEQAKIRELLAARYRLDDVAVDRLIAEARTKGESAVSLYDYVQTLNARLDPCGKADLMTMLWQVAYADGRLDKYEESLLRRIAGMLYVTDAEFIRTKLGVIGQ
jgi:uncharacterized tellurite resistance protein B-like protein